MVRAVHVVIEAQNGRMQSSRVQPGEIVVVKRLLHLYCILFVSLLYPQAGLHLNYQPLLHCYHDL